MNWMICIVGLCLSFLAYIRTDFFSNHSIVDSLPSSVSVSPSEESFRALLQPYRYLGKGRQCYVFVSEDGKSVIKFFNQKYITLPWYGKWLQGERSKREQRQKFARESYSIAWDEDSEILYVHLGKSEKPLPFLPITDKASRFFWIDLNAVSFVLQKKGEPFYPALESMYLSKGSDGLKEGIRQFVTLIAHRIEKKIADADQDVEHNFGVIDGKIFHLDPGRLFFEENLWQPDMLRQEWWRATHRFRRWLLQKYPDFVSFLDSAIETEMTHVSYSL